MLAAGVPSRNSALHIPELGSHIEVEAVLTLLELYMALIAGPALAMKHTLTE